MKVVLLNGSPHTKGCTYTALNEVSQGLNENGIQTEIINIGNTGISGCNGCFSCRNTGRCIQDDIVNQTAEKIVEADGMIIGSPVYFSSPNATLIAYLDRLYAAYGNHLRFKPCGCIVSARRAGTTSALEVLNKYPLVCEQPLVASSYWCMVHGSTPDEVKNDTEGMEIAYNLGRNMSWMVNALKRTTAPVDRK
ncbi:MAG: flavodoxin family protein [Oscillospiraceae bacterium]|nr:flavodoxin family protein [Oscillospiraceae bacterium]